MAAAEDYLEVRKVMDYRLIERGIEYIDQGSDGMKELAKNEQMQRALLEMYRGQAPSMTMGQMMQGMAMDAAKVDQSNETMGGMG